MALLHSNQQTKERVIVVDMVRPDGTYLALPEPTEQWLTYQEALRKKLVCGSRLIILKAEDELKARKKAGRTDLDLVGIVKRIDTK